MDELIARRSKMAEQKIAQAEAQAIADIRSAASEAAVAAAEAILVRTATDKVADDLLARSIAELRDRLN